MPSEKNVEGTSPLSMQKVFPICNNLGIDKALGILIGADLGLSLVGLQSTILYLSPKHKAQIPRDRG